MQLLYAPVWTMQKAISYAVRVALGDRGAENMPGPRRPMVNAMSEAAIFARVALSRILSVNGDETPRAEWFHFHLLPCSEALLVGLHHPAGCLNKLEYLLDTRFCNALLIPPLEYPSHQGKSCSLHVV